MSNGERHEPGAPAPGMIPLSVPEIRGNEWQYLKECLDTGWVSSVGPFVDRFERELAGRVGTQHAVATTSGTAALHVALLVAGVEPDDEVLVPSLTFIAPANAIRYIGAWPVFIDADPDYWQMDPQRVAEFLGSYCHWQNGAVRNRQTGRRVKALIPVHLLGHPVNMKPLLDLARQYHLTVVEDATESLGARYQGENVGHLGEIACFSFNGNKVITTGGGGMIVTDNPAWAERARYLTTQAKDDPVEYIHGAVGYNYRLTNVQAAIGCAQLEQLTDFIARKRRIAQCYAAGLDSVPGITPMPAAVWADSIYWLYTILVDEHVYGESSRQLLRRLHQAGVQTRPLWQPLHLSQVYAGAQVVGGTVAEQLNAQALSLPSSVSLADADVARVLRLIAER